LKIVARHLGTGGGLFLRPDKPLQRQPIAILLIAASAGGNWAGSAFFEEK
jgi:hypothetical protein